MARTTIADVLALIAQQNAAINARFDALMSAAQAPVTPPAQPRDITSAPSVQARATAEPSPAKEAKVADPFAAAKRELRTLRNARKALPLKGPDGARNPEHVSATLALREACVAGYNAGWYKPADEAEFLARMDTWGKLAGPEPVRIETRVKTVRPVADPTGNTAARNVDASAKPKRVMKPEQLAALARGRETAARNRAAVQAQAPAQVAAESADALARSHAALDAMRDFADSEF